MKKPISNLSRAARLGAALLVASPLATAAGQGQKAPKPQPAPALLVASLAGQSVPVLPITFLLGDSIPGLPATRVLQLAWADSIVGGELQARGPEAKWILPPELRRVARRAPGTVMNPDQMGQALMRISTLKRVPDQLIVYLRALTAMTNSRNVMVPAAIWFANTPDGVKAEAELVLADSRGGSVLWRSHPVATAATAGAALTRLMANVLPDVH